MELAYVGFERALSRTYRKVGRVLAFCSDDAFVFHKPWGVQHLPEGSWVLVPLADGRPTGDVYGCHREAFVATYRPIGAAEPHVYEKQAVVHAYQPGKPFAVRTIVGGYSETDPATGDASDWLVQNPGGEVYIVSDAVFSATYVLDNGAKY